MITDPTNLSVLVVDDERKACINLINMLVEFVDPDINIAGVANTTYDAWELIKKHKPDVVFLDVEMPHENAFLFLERIGPIDFEVIFVTAYDEYAVKAFRMNAIDYILKPISISELKNAVQKLKEKIRYNRTAALLPEEFGNLAEQIRNKVKHQKLVLKHNNGTEVIDFKEICFVEAQSSYSRIVFFKNNMIKEITMSNPLAGYEEILPEEMFYRVHRSYLVNCHHIVKVMNDESHHVVMNGDHIIPISRRRHTSLMEFLANNHYT